MSFDAVSGYAPKISVTPGEQTSGLLSMGGIAANNPLKGLSLTVVENGVQIEGPGGNIQIKLENPTIGPEDVPLNELLQQLDGLNNIPSTVFVLGNAADQLVEGTRALAQFIKSTGGQPAADDVSTLSSLASQTEKGALTITQALRHLIENSTYPNYTDFLKELVKVAQELREQATKAKMAAIEGSYQAMMEAADQMLYAAEEAKKSRDEEIAAQRKEAVGQIVAGIVTLVVTGITFGITKDLTFSGQLAQSFSNIVTGTTSALSASDKMTASAIQLRSDLANVAKQRLEASAKLIEQQTAIADDLREIAKGLRDMMLKVYQDFISAQNQVIQRANV